MKYLLFSKIHIINNYYMLIAYTGDFMKNVLLANGDFMKKVLIATWALYDR